MPLEREAFEVYLNPLDDGPPRQVHVVVRHVDMLRGEQEHNRQGLPEKGTNLNLVTAWCWAALMRMGEYAGPYDRFRDTDLIGLEDGGSETVDPTQPVTTDASA